MKNLLIKVCGNTLADNIAQVAALPIDMLGLIFYRQSKRYVSNLNAATLRTVKQDLVGVFVNDSIENIIEKVGDYGLKYVQLHGDESPEFCALLKTKLAQIKVIKAIGIASDTDLSLLDLYSGIDYFLFDTKTIDYGGSGQKFDWQKLVNYQGNIPFFLSGGICIDDADAIINLNKKNKKLIGIDINSKFEHSPGIKDAALIASFLDQLNSVKS